MEPSDDEIKAWLLPENRYPYMKGEVFEHCWHFKSVRDMVCCHCGTLATRHEYPLIGIPFGHGSHYPQSNETMTKVVINGPELCDRKGRAAD